VELRVDTLREPLGIDDPTPSFSWHLRDTARGARQSVYEVQVATTAAKLTENKIDIWDSGRVSSSESLNIGYQGPPLLPSRRYFWRVRIWDAADKPYPESETSWWETGLMTQRNWHAAWIGYETKEEAAVRNAAAGWIASPDAKALADEKLTEQRLAYRIGVPRYTRRVKTPFLHGSMGPRCSRPTPCRPTNKCRGKSM
jgi:alpha-L-rhamnosidase